MLSSTMPIVVCVCVQIRNVSGHVELVEKMHETIVSYVKTVDCGSTNNVRNYVVMTLASCTSYQYNISVENVATTTVMSMITWQHVAVWNRYMSSLYSCTVFVLQTHVNQFQCCKPCTVVTVSCVILHPSMLAKSSSLAPESPEVFFWHWPTRMVPEKGL